MTEVKELNSHNTFSIDEKEYSIDALSDEDKVKLNLIGFAGGELNRSQAMADLMMIAKDQPVKELKASLADD
jgi:hypothetical protein